MNIQLDGKDLLILHLIYQGTPSMHELRHAIQARSVGTIANRLTRMQEAGLIIKIAKRQARSRKITKEGLDVLKAKGFVNASIQFPAGT
jgi:DNA-binding HxlR family transcriptional regulator